MQKKSSTCNFAY